MGETLSYHCPRCGKTHLISYGWFFRSPATAEQVMNGEYGPRAKRNLERHPGTNVMFEYLIFRCSCGHARSKEVMTVFDDDRAPWDRDTRRKPVWDNARCSCPRRSASVCSIETMDSTAETGIRIGCIRAAETVISGRCSGTSRKLPSDSSETAKTNMCVLTVLFRHTVLSSMAKFVVNPTKKKDGFVFSLVASNGAVIGTSQTYRSSKSAQNGIESVRFNRNSLIEDQTFDGYEILTNPKYEIYKDDKGEFRFRLKAMNGDVVFTSDGYSSKASAKNGIESIRKNAEEAKVEVLEK